MKTIASIDFMDFYFNGHYLSEFGGYIGGKERLSNYPLLPPRVFTTDRAINQDGDTVFSSYLEPRPFEVPIFFENIDFIGIRKISKWLDTKQPTWFYYKNDSLKIMCTLDGGGTDLESLSGVDGSASLKFIAHDPYYYELNETTYKYDKLTGTSRSYVFDNIGSEESVPYMSIWGSGDITINIYNGNKTTLYKTCIITSVTSGFVIDSKYKNCVLQSGLPWFHKLTGEFPTFPVGTYTVEILGSVVGVEILPKYRMI